MAWVLLAAFSQIDSENQKQKTKLEGLEKSVGDQKEIICNMGAKENLSAEEISIIKNKKALYTGTGRKMSEGPTHCRLKGAKL